MARAKAYFKPEQLNKRLKPSRFYESFIQSKGPSGVAMASPLEIQKQMKSYFLDLIYGNIVQEKYQDFLYEPRVLREALASAEQKLLRYSAILQSMDLAIQSNQFMITSNPEFYNTYDTYVGKATAFSIILKGLQAFANTGDTGYLISISTQMNSYLMANAKQQVLI